MSKDKLTVLISINSDIYLIIKHTIKIYIELMDPNMIFCLFIFWIAGFMRFYMHAVWIALHNSNQFYFIWNHTVHKHNLFLMNDHNLAISNAEVHVLVGLMRKPALKDIKLHVGVNGVRKSLNTWKVFWPTHNSSRTDWSTRTLWWISGFTISFCFCSTISHWQEFKTWSRNILYF